MKGLQRTDTRAYHRVIEAFKRGKEGATAADIVARTGLPLEQVRELIPAAADEFSARLAVTESGEIRYYFPGGFKSKYRGLRPWLRRAGKLFLTGARIAGTWTFKVWIMVMLVGYFILFMLLALAAMAISVVSVSGRSDNRSSSGRGGGIGGMYMASSLLNFIIRIWFFSELTKPVDVSSSRWEHSRKRPKGRPLYQAIFSFVFGDGDPNRDWNQKERRSVIAYIQSHHGVISLPEFMNLTGRSPADAEESISSYCLEFSGSPEVSEDGTIVYRFDELLLRADRTDRSFPGLSGPIKALRRFSSNTKKMNRWFGVINGANLAFGSYFLYQSLNTGLLIPETALPAGSYLYAVAYIIFGQFMANPIPFIMMGLGAVPLVFSLLFWLIPGLRFLWTGKTNEGLKTENFRKEAYGRIWERPLRVRENELDPKAAESRPKNLDAARDRIIKEIGSYSQPDVSLDDSGNTVYSFTGLEEEKVSVEKYRKAINPEASELGETVFDSHDGL